MMPVLGWIVAVVPSEIGSPSCRRHMNKFEAHNLKPHNPTALELPYKHEKDIQS